MHCEVTLVEPSTIKPLPSNFGGFLLFPAIRICSAVSDDKSTTPLQKSDLLRESFSCEFHCNVTLKVSEIAYFVFDFSADAAANFPDGKLLDDFNDRIKSRMRFANLYLACLYTILHRSKSPVFDKMYIDDSTYIAARSNDLNPYHATCSIRQAGVIDSAFRFPHPILTISTGMLENAAQLLNTSIAAHGNSSLVLADLLLQAFSLFKHNHYETVQVVAWTINEHCLNFIWEQYLNKCSADQTAPDNRPFINSDRRNKLTGRDFSASTISEILSLAGKIDFITFEKLNGVRQDRNRWLHSMTPINRVQSCASLNLAIEMLRYSSILDVDFTIPLISSPLLAFTDT